MNLYIKMLVFISLSTFYCNVFSQCTNMLLVEHVTYKDKSYNKLPGLQWKNIIVNNYYAKEIYTPLNDTYELMLHASNNYKGVLIHRICKKNTNYKKYGTINSIQLRGYLIESDNIFLLDRMLYKNHFKTYNTSRCTILNYDKEQAIIKEKEFRSKSQNMILSLIYYDIPRFIRNIIYFISSIIYFIVYNILLQIVSIVYSSYLIHLMLIVYYFY